MPSKAPGEGLLATELTPEPARAEPSPSGLGRLVQRPRAFGAPLLRKRPVQEPSNFIASSLGPWRVRETRRPSLREEVVKAPLASRRRTRLPSRSERRCPTAVSSVLEVGASAPDAELVEVGDAVLCGAREEGGAAFTESSGFVFWDFDMGDIFVESGF